MRLRRSLVLRTGMNAERDDDTPRQPFVVHPNTEWNATRILGEQKANPPPRRGEVSRTGYERHFSLWLVSFSPPPEALEPRVPNSLAWKFQRHAVARQDVKEKLFPPTFSAYGSSTPAPRIARGPTTRLQRLSNSRSPEGRSQYSTMPPGRALTARGPACPLAAAETVPLTVPREAATIAVRHANPRGHPVPRHLWMVRHGPYTPTAAA